MIFSTLFIMLLNLINTNAFNIFSSKIELKTKSNKVITLEGNGPPLLFSTAIYDLVPNKFYSNFQNMLKTNFTVINSNDFKSLQSIDVEEIAMSLGVESIALFSHSSISGDILNSEYLNSAVLCYPISHPNMNLDGISKKYMECKSPILIIEGNDSKFADRNIPDFQFPNIEGNIEKLTLDNFNQIDILDDFWIDAALKTNLWEKNSISTTNFSDWDINNNIKINKKQKDYNNKLISSKCSEFIYNKNGCINNNK